MKKNTKTFNRVLSFISVLILFTVVNISVVTTVNALASNKTVYYKTTFRKLSVDGIEYDYLERDDKPAIIADRPIEEVEHTGDYNWYKGAAQEYPVGTNIIVDIPAYDDFPGVYMKCVVEEGISANVLNIQGDVSIYDIVTHDSDECTHPKYDEEGRLLYHSWTREERSILLDYTTEMVTHNCVPNSLNIILYSKSAGKGYDLKLSNAVSTTEVGGIYQEDTTHGSSFSGEDFGVEIITEILESDPETLAVDIGGALAVAGILGTAAAASGNGNSGNSKDKRKKKDKDRKKTSYKMYVYKEFGDAIRKTDPPVKVYARVSKIVDGVESDCPEQTARIQPSGTDLTVQNGGMEGRYLCAIVTPDRNSDAESGTVIFTLKGPGGVFRKKIDLRLVDQPSLLFVEDGEDESSWQPLGNECAVDMIIGDGFTYTRQFMIRDALTMPQLSDLKAANTRGFDVTFETTDYQGVYAVKIRNTTKPDQDHDVFADHNFDYLQILVNMEGEKELSGSIKVSLYHEGLTVAEYDSEKKGTLRYIPVRAYEMDSYGDLESPWQNSRITMTLAVIDGDHAVINPKEGKIRFDRLKGAGGLGTSANKENSLAEKYKYEVEPQTDREQYIYYFTPDAHLCEPEDGSFYMVMLPVEAEYQGRRYQMDIPVRLRGEFVDPYTGWDEEYELLKKCVEKFSLPEERTKWFLRIEHLMTDPVCSTAELHLTRKSIVRNYMDYWLIESIAFRNDIKLYDSIISDLEWVKFVGDCAFSFLVNAYAGPLADAIISPAKDFFAESAGELIACWNQGTEVRLENFYIVKYMEAAGDNLFSNNINLANWKQAAATLAAYFVYASFREFQKKLREENEIDLYGALVKGFSDMSVQALKAAFGELLGRWIKNSRTVRKWIVKHITKNMDKSLTKLKLSKFDMKDQRFWTENIPYQINKEFGLKGDWLEFKGATNEIKILKREILMKYLTELLGVGAGWVKEKTDAAYDSVEDFSVSMNEYGHIIVSFSMAPFEDGDRFDISVDLTKVALSTAAPLFSILFDDLFSRIPTHPHPVQAPAVPQLPPRE